MNWLLTLLKKTFAKNHCEDAIEAVPGNLLKNETENLILLLQIF